MIKKYILAISIIMSVCGVFAGCGKKSAAGSQAFAKAAPEIKEVWEKAIAADQANDYLTAITNYQSLMVKKSTLTDPQVEALNSAALAINQRLYAAANNGDAAAKEASAKLVKMQMGR